MWYNVVFLTIFLQSNLWFQVILIVVFLNNTFPITSKLSLTLEALNHLCWFVYIKSPILQHSKYENNSPQKETLVLEIGSSASHYTPFHRGEPIAMHSYEEYSFLFENIIAGCDD